MLTLFNDVTRELSKMEKETLVPMLLETLSNTHETNKYTTKHLTGWFDACRIKVSDARIRKMINYIRTHYLTKPHMLVGTSKGYFLTMDSEIVDAQIDSIQGRIDAEIYLRESFKEQRDYIKKLKSNN